MDMQNVSNLVIPEGEVRTIHDKDNRLLWSKIAYSVEYSGDTSQQTYSGKNKVDLVGGTAHGLTSKNNGDGTITISGTATNTGGFGIMGANLALPAGTYTLSISKPLPFLVNLAIASGVAFRIPAGGTSATTTLAQSYSSGNLFIAMTSGTTYNETFGIQIVPGSAPDYDFEPYVGGIPAPNPDYPQEVQTVTGEQTVEVTGKNLIYTNPRTNEGITFSYNSTNGVTAISGTPTLTYAISATNSVSIPAGTYTISIDSPKPFNIGIGTRNASNVRTPTYIPAGSTSVTITRTEPVVGYDIYVSGLTSGTYISDEFKLMLEQGSTATAYELYQSHSYTISLGSLELCKIGDYQDYIHKSGDDWYVHKEIMRIVYDGEGETWSKAGDGSMRMALSPDAVRGSSSNNPIMSNQYVSRFSTSINNSIFLSGGQSQLGIADNVNAGDYQTWKSWLNSNNLIVYYALGTPTDTKITNTALIAQLDYVHQWLTRYGYESTVSGNLPIVIAKTNL